MALNIREAYTFDDVLLVPKYSNIKSRADVDTSIALSKGLAFNHPLIPANMKTVTDIDMANAMYQLGGMAILHRFMSVEEQLSIAKRYSADHKTHIGFSVGVKEEDYKIVDKFAAFGVRILCIDVAHGDSQQCVNMARYIAEKYPDIFLIAGNVVTKSSAKMLWNYVDCVKSGVGSGAICLTRVRSGNGVPQLSALSEIADARSELQQESIAVNKPIKPMFIISDGGAKNSGDLVKALCLSDMVMAGGLFAGSDEAPGEILKIDGKEYKQYVGSSTHKTNNIEGVEALVPAKGPVKNVLNTLLEGIRSGLSYQGCRNLTELKNNPIFVKITNAGLKESGAHDVIVIK